MSFVAIQPQDYVPLRLSLGRPTLWDHIGTAVDTTLYDLPVQNIDRAMALHNAEKYSTISAEEANKRYGIKDQVQFDAPISWKKAELISKFKREEIERMQMLALGNDSFFRKSAFFVSSLGAQAMDPINLAAMFVPVVSEQRFAALVGKVGLNQARLIAGTLEAGVGMAMVEPFSYLSKSFGEQNVYGVRETAMNMILGTVMGASLRLGGGKVKDLIVGRYDPDTAMTKAATAREKAGDALFARRLRQAAENKAKQQGFKKGTPQWDGAVERALKEGSDVQAELKLVSEYLAQLTPEQHRKAFTEGINNVLNDEPIAGPKVELELDELEAQRQQMIEANIEQEVTGTVKIDPTDHGTEISVGKTKVIMTAENDVVSLKINEPGEAADLQGIIMGQAKAALKQGKDLVINGERMNQEVLSAFVEGTDAVATPPKPKNMWDDYPDEIVVDLESPEHLDFSTPEKAHESNVKTADEINAQAEQILEDIKQLIGKKNVEKTLAIAQKQDIDPKDLAEILTADPTGNKKYREWLAKQFKAGHIQKEDIAKVKERLQQFQDLAKKALFTDEKDLNKYQNYQQLAKTVDKYIEKEGGVALQEKLRKAGDGAKIVKEPSADNPLTVVESSDAKACSTMGEGTEWCTKSQEVAGRYLHGNEIDSGQVTKITNNLRLRILDILSKFNDDDVVRMDQVRDINIVVVDPGVMGDINIIKRLHDKWLTELETVRPDGKETYGDFKKFIDRIETLTPEENKLYQVFDENGEPLAQIDPKSGQIMDRNDAIIRSTQTDDRTRELANAHDAQAVLYSVPEDVIEEIMQRFYRDLSENPVGPEQVAQVREYMKEYTDWSDEQIANGIEEVVGLYSEEGTYRDVERRIDEVIGQGAEEAYLGPEKTAQLRQAIDEAGIRSPESDIDSDLNSFLRETDNLAKQIEQPVTKAKPTAEDTAAQMHQQQLNEINALMDEYDIPDNMRQQILDDFEAPSRLEDEQTGINAAIDCIIRNMI